MATQTNFNVDRSQKLFLNNLGNGKAAAKHFNDIMHHVVAHGDTGVFNNLLTKVEARKDRQAVKAMRSIFSTVYPDAKVVGGEKGSPRVFKIAKCKADQAAMARLEKHTSGPNALSLRDALATAVKQPKSEKSEAQLKAEAKAKADEKQAKLKAFIEKASKEKLTDKAKETRLKIAELEALAATLEKAATKK